MPTYKFECTRCYHQFDKFLSITEQKPDSCPLCSSLIKTVPVAIPFSGSGEGWAGSKGQNRGNE